MTRISMIRLGLPALVLALSGLVAGCADPVSPESGLAPDAPALAASAASASWAASDQSCWGQATKVFAQLGDMGPHSAEQPTPRLGLARLARALYAQGIIPEPTMQALGAFVAAELGLTIDACMTE